ncbi:P-loop containing nucleoside triphosphate hydrolase protein [Amylostereum chailletii]|nr:P-loop containing nucleoside triphosphate hydrolase protein [Amylostereum chailletii]
MEAFQLLSRGGAHFDKRRFKNDVILFNVRYSAKSRLKCSYGQSKLVATGELPSELDFFKYAQADSFKRKADTSLAEESVKRRRMDIGGEEKQEDQETGPMHQTKDSKLTPKQRVTTKGLDIPAHVQSFEELRERYKVSSHIMVNLSKYGYDHPTGIQSYGCPILLESRDLAAISPTGTGKTLSYLLPIMSALGAPSASSGADVGSGVRAVILAPTRELAHQIHNECLKLAQVREREALVVRSDAAMVREEALKAEVGALCNVGTPLRLVSAVQEGHLELGNVRHLILDEADRMLDSEFLSQVQEVVSACTHDAVQKAVFSATLPAGVEKVAMNMLRNPVRIVVGLKDTPLPLISQSLTYVAEDSSKLPTLLAYLSQPYNPPVVIFTSSQPRATSLAEELVLHDIPNVDCLHAGMTNKEREDAVRRMQRGESWVLVSTEVMARGMDFKGVREVINYDFPQSVQSYIHRIGRTGRAGRDGKAVTYFTDEDAPYLKSIANVLLQSGSTVPEWILKLPKPSKIKRKQMGKVKRAEAVNPARSIGRNEAIKKRDMIAGSKRRQAKVDRRHKQDGEGDDSDAHIVVSHPE